MDAPAAPPPAPAPAPAAGPGSLRSRLRRYRRTATSLLVIVLAVIAVRSSLADHVRVPTGSMMPTVEAGDRVLVNKSAYGIRIPLTEKWAVHFDGPAAGDVVVLDAPDEDKLLLKRVVATPGDTITVRAGHIILNGTEAPVTASADGAQLYETLNGVRHAVRLDRLGGPDYGPETMPPGRYLVMGDNRGDSRDGRYFGLVRRSAILGRASVVFMRGGWPVWRGL
jgi:signal peptidase I